MSLFAKLQPVFIVLAALFGTFLGERNAFIERYSGNFIEVFLMLMLVFIFLGADPRAITRSFANYRFSVTSLLINFVWTPLFAFALTRLFMPESVDLQIGFIMLMVTPCTDWYLIFTGLSEGNVTLGASVLPMNLSLQIVMLPLYIFLFMGASASFDALTVIKGIVIVLFIPLIAAYFIRVTMTKTGKRAALKKILSKSDDMQFILLGLAIIAMFASQGNIMLENLPVFLKILPPLLIFFPVNFILALFIGGKIKLPFKDAISLVFTVSARNSPLSLAIAVITFPARPIISLVLVMGPLIELPILAVESFILKNMFQRPRGTYTASHRKGATDGPQ